MDQKTSLKSTQISIFWKNLSASVENKKILSNVQGYCRQGDMLAIMGPSGAGKTTLLSLLAAKHNKALLIEGTVLANNKQFTAKQFYNFGVYIFQNDILHANLTVRQTLSFISKLQIKDSQIQQQRVNQMISIFQLQKCQDTYVGGQWTKGISGGQKKRVCIAVQMIYNPSVIILDQPTSGLDSHMVLSVIKVLKKLAKQKHKTIIFTLHQPSFLLYQQLDRLLILNKGITIYQGKSSYVYEYLQNTLKITVPLDRTLSDFFMMEISQYKHLKDNDYVTRFNQENYCLYLKPDIELELKEATNVILHIGFDTLQTARTFFSELFILLSRQLIIIKRNPIKGLRIIFTSTIIVINAGLIFMSGISENRPLARDQNLNDPFQLIIYFLKAQGVAYIGILSCIMSSVNNMALSFPNDKQIYYKQSSSKKYRPASYLLSKIITEVGSCATGALIFATGQFFLVGYTRTVEQYLKFILVFIICSLVGNSLGFMIGSIFKDARKASALTPLFLMPLMMFSGMYNRLDSIPKWISWIQYISPFKYPLHAVMVNEYHEQIFMTILGPYDYRKDLEIYLSYEENILILLGLALISYTISFVILNKMSSNLAP